MTYSVTVAQMRSHVRQLCEANRIAINYDRHASASYREREIWIRAVRSSRAYAVALHEIGHILGRYQLSRATLVRERHAWDWARRNGLRWTPEMRRHADRCLEHYARQESIPQHKATLGGPLVSQFPSAGDVAAQRRKRTSESANASKRHSGSQMNWPRGLFRVWVVESVLWAIGYGWYFWHSCWLQSDTGDYWCFTGESDWMEPLRHFGWREYLYNLGWVFGVPLLVLLISSATYAVLKWIDQRE